MRPQAALSASAISVRSAGHLRKLRLTPAIQVAHAREPVAWRLALGLAGHGAHSTRKSKALRLTGFRITHGAVSSASGLLVCAAATTGGEFS